MFNAERTIVRPRAQVQHQLTSAHVYGRFEICSFTKFDTYLELLFYSTCRVCMD